MTKNLTKNYLPEGLINIHQYKFNQNHPSYNSNITSLISEYFSPIKILASQPKYTITSKNVIIHLFYYSASKKTLNNNTINNLGEVLNKQFKQSVELRLVKQTYPYLNSDILAQYIALNTEKYKFVRIIRRIFSSIGPTTGTIHTLANSLPSHIVGIKVCISGRLMTERSQPRKTVQTAEIGSFSKNNLSLVEKASFSTQNKKGAFTVKVWISQRAIV